MTYSLIGWSSALLGVCIIFPYLYRFASRKRLWGWTASTVTGIILGCILLNLFHPQSFYPDSFKGIEPLKKTLEQTSDMFIEKPFTGYGYGHFEEEYVLYSARQHQLNPDYPPPYPALSHPHNEILYWGTEGGVIPVLAMMLAVLFILLRIYYAKSKTRLATLSLLFPVALHSQLDNVFALSSIHWITFVILLFWTDQRVAKYKNIDLKPVALRLIYLFIYILPATTCCYMGGILTTQYVFSLYQDTHDTRWLNTIHYPFIWKDKLMQARLSDALKKAGTDQLSSFKPWLLNLIRKEPRPEHYRSLIELYRKMGDVNHAEQTRLEALYLFPDFEHQRVPKNTSASDK
ncbi:PglL family O-oligosaccharyltransferase [Vibrio aerogenes]|nr:Wzy polymerase domain-containing protein [Vibrio aerogenes]